MKFVRKLRQKLISPRYFSLKAVTGDAEKIDQETDKVKDQVRKLEGFAFDVFSDRYAA